MQCATPPEPRFGGLRKQISVGDSASESTELFGQLGTGFASSRPELSRRLMGMWRAQGETHSSFHGTTLLKIDAGLSSADPALGSASFPGQFTVLRHGWGTPREDAVWLPAGNHYVDHATPTRARSFSTSKARPFRSIGAPCTNRAAPAA